MLNKSSLIGDKAPPTACDSIEVARALTQRCYPGRHSQILSGSLPLSVGFTTQDEAMDVGRSAPQESHYHTNVPDLLKRKKRCAEVIDVFP